MLAPFVRVDDGLVTFIHNSLIAFLRSETRSRIPGSDPRLRMNGTSIPFLRTGPKDALVSTPSGVLALFTSCESKGMPMCSSKLSSDWLRSAMDGFIPYAHLHPILLAGCAAACAKGDWGHLLRLILLSYELDQRTSRVGANNLAKALLDLDDPLLALSQIRSEGRLLVEDKDALRFSGALWYYAHHRNRSDRSFFRI